MNIVKSISIAAVSLLCVMYTASGNSASAQPTGSPSASGSSLFDDPQQKATTRQAFNPIPGPDYPVAPDTYFTDDSGNILMYIKVIGNVNKQGPMVVREDVDFSEILANAGGLKPNTNLHEVLVARQKPDENGKQAYIVDLKKFYKYGDRSMFIALKPNDTIIFPEKGISIDKLAKISSIIYPWANVYSTYERNH
jgi:hypothetical protein